MAAVSGPRFGRKCEYYSDNAAAAHIVSVMSETIRRHTSYCHRNEVVSKLREKFNKYFWPRDECGPKIKQFVAEARRQRHQQAPGSCLIINWCVPTKKFTENLQEHEFMLGLRCRGRGRELFITVVYDIFLGGNIYMFGAEARPAGRRRY